MLQIQVNQQERQLTISGERGEPQVAGPGSEANDRKSFERSFGKFSRTLSPAQGGRPGGHHCQVRLLLRGMLLLYKPLISVNTCADSG